MKKFTRAIVKRPCRKMTDGITTANLGKPVYENSKQKSNEKLNFNFQIKELSN